MSKDTSFCLRTDRELMGWRFTFQGRSTIKKFRFRVQRQLFRKSKKAGPSVDAISLLLRRSFCLSHFKYINDNTKSSLFLFFLSLFKHHHNKQHAFDFSYTQPFQPTSVASSLGDNEEWSSCRVQQQKDSHCKQQQQQQQQTTTIRQWPTTRSVCLFKAQVE